MGDKNKSRSSQRRGRQMARTNKIIESNKSDDHMGKEAQLRKDLPKQLENHINKRVRKGKDLDPLPTVDPAVKPDERDDEVRTLEEVSDQELVTTVDGSNLIVGIRAYEKGDDGLPVGRDVTGDEFCAVHRQTRRERENYIELNGSRVKVGQESRRYDNSSGRMNLKRKAPGILKSIMVRLMPHEGEAVLGMPAEKLNEAMDATVAEWAKATGCEVLTAAAHRMSATDCHIHIQYTMVQAIEESKHMLGRRLTPWKKEASEMARESLAADRANPAPAAIGARIIRLIAEGTLPPKPVAGIDYAKLPGDRDLGDGAILGYSFRQKLNLVRAAEAAGEVELGAKVAERNDYKGMFVPIARRDDADLEERYLDLWLERVWRRNVAAQLPDDRKAELVPGGLDAAQNYAAFGTTMVEESHIRRRAKELAAEAKAIDAVSLAAKLTEEAALRRVKAMEEQVAIFSSSAAEAKKSAEAAKLAEAAALRRVEEMEEQVAKFSISAKDAEKSAEAAKLAKAAAIRRMESMEEQVAKSSNSAKEVEKSAEAAKLAEAAALRQVAAMTEKIEQFTESTKDTAAILTIIQEIIDEPVLRAILESLTALWEKIVVLAARVGLNMSKGGPEIKKPVGPDDVGMAME